MATHSAGRQGGSESGAPASAAGASQPAPPSVTQREDAVAAREVAVGQRERRLDDLREANAHLVQATLMAEKLEEAAKETRRRQDEFLAMLAHELRNPLAPIRSAVALLDRIEQLDPRVQNVREVVRRQVAHMARLLDDLLDASRVTSGKVALRRDILSVGSFVDLGIELSRPLIEARQQHFEMVVQSEPVFVEGDATRLAQVVSNLLNNAAKYTLEGGHITLTIGSDATSVLLRIKDDGMGIARSALDTVFELFAQEERSLSRSQGGLGIGLTVVRSMVEQHGGTVTVTSGGAGKGSEFTVVLPRVHQPPRPESKSQVEASSAARTGRILVADDNVDAATMLAMLLQMSGYQVDVAHDGPGTVAACLRHRPDMVVCDIGLPGMNGYEVAKRIRGEPAATPVFLVALTGYDEESDRQMALAAGFDHHVAKPVDFDSLLQLLPSR